MTRKELAELVDSLVPRLAAELIVELSRHGRFGLACCCTAGEGTECKRIHDEEREYLDPMEKGAAGASSSSTAKVSELLRSARAKKKRNGSKNNSKPRSEKTCTSERSNCRSSPTEAAEKAERVQGRKLTVAEALAKYEEYLTTTRGNKPATVASTLYRLRAMFGDQSMSLLRVTPRKAEELYQALAKRWAVDTHRNTLGQTKTVLALAGEEEVGAARDVR